LGREGLEEKLTQNLIEEGFGHVGRDTLLIADISDVSKKYAKKMEHLANIRDGSEDKIRKGYWTMKVIGAEVEKGKIIPLYEWRQGAILAECPWLHQRERVPPQAGKAVERLRKSSGDRGVWVMDRGGDRGELLIPLLDHASGVVHHPAEGRPQRYISQSPGHRLTALVFNQDALCRDDPQRRKRGREPSDHRVWLSESQIPRQEATTVFSGRQGVRRHPARGGTDAVDQS